jgi:hypothetical protein
MESLFWLMSTVLEVPLVFGAFVGALEIAHEYLLQVRPVLDPFRGEMFEPHSRQVSKEQWQVADDEMVTIRPTGSTGEPVTHEP